MIIVGLIVAAIAALFAADWRKTSKLKKELNAPRYEFNTQPGSTATFDRTRDYSTNMDIVNAQATSLRNQSLGPF